MHSISLSAQRMITVQAGLHTVAHRRRTGHPSLLLPIHTTSTIHGTRPMMPMGSEHPSWCLARWCWRCLGAWTSASKTAWTRAESNWKLLLHPAKSSRILASSLASGQHFAFPPLSLQSSQPVRLHALLRELQMLPAGQALPHWFGCSRQPPKWRGNHSIACNGSLRNISANILDGAEGSKMKRSALCVRMPNSIPGRHWLALIQCPCKALGQIQQ